MTRRGRGLLVGAAALTLLCTAGGVQALTAPEGQSTPEEVVEQVTQRVNEEREKAGCEPVTLDNRLENAAQGHSSDMAERDFFSHTNPDGEGPGDRVTDAGYTWKTYGENIARGQGDAEAVMDSWMNSEGHRENILNCDFEEMGVGFHEASGGPWWTQDFGTAR